MTKIAIDELRRLYGLSEAQSDTIEDAVCILQISAEANQAYFIIKFDGERPNNKFTAIFNAQHVKNGIIRVDADSMSACIDYVLREILNLKRADMIR